MTEFLQNIGPPTWGDIIQIVAFLGTILKLHIMNRERVFKLEIKADLVEEKIDKIESDVSDLRNHLLGKRR